MYWFPLEIAALSLLFVAHSFSSSFRHQLSQIICEPDEDAPTSRLKEGKGKEAMAARMHSKGPLESASAKLDIDPNPALTWRATPVSQRRGGGPQKGSLVSCFFGRQFLRLPRQLPAHSAQESGSVLLGPIVWGLGGPKVEASGHNQWGGTSSSVVGQASSLISLVAIAPYRTHILTETPFRYSSMAKARRGKGKYLPPGL